MADEDLSKYQPDNLEPWQRYQGLGDPPPCWHAVNPKTNERVMVYRSYADYVWD